MKQHQSLNASACLFLSVFIIITVPCTIPAKLDRAHIASIDSIEVTLRRDYLLCTHDSSEVSLAALLAWRKSIDSVIQRDNYASITKKFFEETGLSPTNVRPCEIVTWMQSHKQQLDEYTAVLDESRDTVIQRKEDSLFLADDLSKAVKAPYDLLDIPFGITKRSFLLLTARYQKNLSPQGDIILFDSLPYGMYHFSIAFHFTSSEIYRAYEIESATAHFDSLNAVIRPVMLYMATHFEATTTTPPNHIYRVGQFDIVPGRLAICRLWTFPQATAYFGLARTGNRFYAKAIVRREE